MRGRRMKAFRVRGDENNTRASGTIQWDEKGGCQTIRKQSVILRCARNDSSTVEERVSKQ